MEILFLRNFLKKILRGKFLGRIPSEENSEEISEGDSNGISEGDSNGISEGDSNGNLEINSMPRGTNYSPSISSIFFVRRANSSGL
jgi:hypothetical protein